MMKTNQNNHIMNMNKGMKQKLSMLLIACLLFTGYRGLTIPGRAEQGNTEQSNAISVSGTQVKVQLLGEDLRRAAKEAIEKGERVDDSVLKGYSKDEELQKSYAGIFSLDKEVYEIPLDSISEGLSESLAEEEAGLQVFVERDAQDLDNLVRKESKESLLLYDGKSQLEQLFPKGEETGSVKKEEEENLASDSNLERNTELTGSELITFLYKNKADHRITFQLSVDGNKYPKVTVSPKTQLFKELVDKLKKEEKKVPVETAKVPESKIEESAETKGATSEEQLAESTTSSEEVKETAEQAASKEETTVASVTEASTQGSASKVSIVSEEKKEETSEQETSEAAVKAEEKNEESAEAETATEAPVKKESAKEAEVKFSGFLQDVISHYEEFLGELVSARFSQYSLNELGRKSQNVEIEGFATVEVFYEEAAFDRDVVLEAKRLFKPEEEAEGEKLSEEQVKVLKEHSIYDDGASLDIRFVDKKDPSVEVEPLSPVGVRITLEKKALPETVSPDAISIHHLVENDETKEIEKVDTVVHASSSKNLTEFDYSTISEEVAEQAGGEASTLKTNNNEGDTKKETITKEFTVDSFSLYQITWKSEKKGDICAATATIRFHYVDKNFNEIGPTKRVEIEANGANWQHDDNSHYLSYVFDAHNNPVIDPQTNKQKTGWFKYGSDEKERWYLDREELGQKVYYDSSNKSYGDVVKRFYGYDFLEVYPYDPKRDNMDVWKHGKDRDYFTINWLYGPGDGDFREGIKRIDNLGYTLSTTLPGSLTPRYAWFYKAKGEKQITQCDVHDFYFVYDTKRKQADKRTIEDVESRNEKYIKDNLDGTYELTLTGQIKSKNKEKQKLDIIFLLDSTQSMKLPFNKNFTEHSKNDYLNSGNNKKNITKRYIESLVDNLSQNSNYDLQYALVGFGGERKEDNIKDIVYAGNDNIITKVSNAQGKQLEIIDTAWNDTTHVYGFTTLDTFKENLKNLPESNSEETGANYNAAIAGLNYLLKDQSANLMTDRITNNSGVLSDNGRRDDAKKIIIMLASTDPMYSYIVEDGVYDDTFLYSVSLTDKKLREGYKPNRSAGIEFYTDFKRGDSYGNGQYFSRVALNQARGLLSTLDGYSAFYTVGIGNENNWKHLKELTEEHGHDQKTDTWALLGTKFIRAKSALAEGADSKVFDGSTAEKLEASFTELENKIAPKASNITITDTLSENVTFVKDTELKVEVYKMKSNEVEPDGNALTEDDLKAMGLNKFILEKPSAALEQGGEIKLTTDPADFALPAGYEIRLTATIKPSQRAYLKQQAKEGYKDTGEKRTDLNDIYQTYLHKKYGDDKQYGTSTDKKGLFTNDEAKFGYKWKGVDKERKYNKPIIRLKGYLKVYKDFQDMDGRALDNSLLYNPSTKSFTNLGRQIFKNIYFDIYKIDGTNQKLLTTINIGDERWINEPLKSHHISQDKVDITINPYESQVTQGGKTVTERRFSFTVNNMPMDSKYQIIERVLNETTVLKENGSDSNGYRFGGKNNKPTAEGVNSMNQSQGGNTYVFANKYMPVLTPKKNVTIKKLVQEFGNTAVSNVAKADTFDFYMVLYKGNEAFSTQDVDKYLLNLDSGTRNLIAGSEMISVKESGTTKTLSAIHFKLQHNKAISLPLDNGVKFQVFELKDKGYEKAKILNGGTASEMTVGNKTYTHTGKLDNSGQTITFQNPKITAIPTGLRGDITPYLFSIFGFTMMAGMYLTIRKRKRVEI